MYLVMLFTFFAAMVLLTLVLYVLSCVIFSSGIDDELQIERLYAYECGYSAFSDARDAFDIKFYLVAVLFLIFDLEISFLFPMAVSLSALSFYEVFISFVFLGVLTLGFVYEWKKGAIDW